MTIYFRTDSIFFKINIELIEVPRAMAVNIVEKTIAKYSRKTEESDNRRSFLGSEKKY